VKLNGPVNRAQAQAYKGVLAVRKTRWGYVAQAWPRKRGPPKSPAQADQVAAFKQAIEWAKNPDPYDYALAVEGAKGSGMYPRDILERAMFGQLVICYMKDGTILQGRPQVATSIQTLLNQITEKEGSIIFRGVANWEGLNAGPLGYVLKSNGPDSDPSWQAEAGGGGNGLFAAIAGSPPTLAGAGLTTWVNQGSNATSDTEMGISFTGVSDSSHHYAHGLTVAVPATPYKLSILALGNEVRAFNALLFGWYDGANKLDVLSWQAQDTTGDRFLLNHATWASPTGASSFSSLVYSQPMTWLQIEDDGTTITMRRSSDGVLWVQMYSVAKSSGYLGASGYANIFLGIDCYNQAAAFTVAAWIEA